ncbi:hypothetical protein PV08_08668 [Exophiala spinifera]|uniref:Dolichol-phosphate mannosyltransferase n=1 Tax=Exophiala spinifera TaxID=91928 RepID=A0A0D2B471_9EURO|nr:uncharacterized protein PV08_08668 [Exophiala spinifera]KIW13480.1 hypothetical protein PV08_08668 [Exophiala spinifera]
MECILHKYFPKRYLLLLEYLYRTPSNAGVTREAQPPNVLLFIGGLYDSFRSPGYVDDLAALFPRNAPNQKWRVMHVQLSSAGRAFGVFDLNRDVEEISHAIRYIRENVTQSSSTPVVIMGHSTGCQDVMHYLTSATSSSPSQPRSVISGAIMQAPVSDREAILDETNKKPDVRESYEKALATCASTPVSKHTTTILPTDITKDIVGSAPISISRFLSLASPDSPARPSIDDYFSSDLSDEHLLTTFGRIGSVEFLQPEPTGSMQEKQKSILILESGSDGAVPAYIDKHQLIGRWKHAIEAGSDGKATSSSHSMVVPNAVHDIGGTTIEARTARLIDMRGAVLRYLQDVVGDIGHETDSSGPWPIWQHDKKAIEAEAGVTDVKL